MNFLHSGKIGDLIYALPAVKGMGDGPHTILCCSRPIVGTFMQSWLDAVRPLLLSQSYIEDCRFQQEELIDYDFTNFRHFRFGRTLAENQCYHIQHGNWDIRAPWLKIDANPHNFIVINRSLRYHNPAFDWKGVIDRYGERLVFIGLPEEHEAFTAAFGRVKYHYTENLLVAAKWIAGSPLFIGNQSSPMAIAQGLKHRLIQESWPQRADCIFERENAQHVFSGHGVLPDL